MNSFIKKLTILPITIFVIFSLLPNFSFAQTQIIEFCMIPANAGMDVCIQQIERAYQEELGKEAIERQERQQELQPPADCTTPACLQYQEELSREQLYAGDTACSNLGGSCQYTSSPCSGNYASGKCLSSSEANYQCCVPSDAKAGGALTSEKESSKRISIANPLGVKTFADLIAKINNWLIWIGAPILTLMVLIGAFQIMLAGSTPENITKGRHTITWAIIGYGLLLISTGITTIIKNVLGAQ